MIRLSQVMSVLVLGLSAAAAEGQTPATPRPAHSEEPPPEAGKKANPADAASPPLADPLKQQAVTDPPPTLATPAVQFIMQASMESLTDLQTAQVALKQSSSSTVQRFARRMLEDHRRLSAQLETLATQKGTSAPEVLDSEHAGSVQRLAPLSGKRFDTAYAAQARSAAARALALYTAASSLNDADVGRFASGTLPTLRAHDSEARLLR